MKQVTQNIMAKIIPLHRSELSKFLCIATMILLITYIHTVLKISKDALVISHLGTETISAIKMWVVVPASIIFMLAYIKLADIFTRSRLFHLMNWFFISYFILFATVLYPYRELLTLNIGDAIVASAPATKYIFKVINNWHYCLFYFFSEMWVTIMLSISLWQTANHITTTEESKRFYPLLGLAAQFGLMAASLLSQSFVAQGTNWQPTLNNVTTSMTIAGTLLSLTIFALGKTIGIENLNSTGPALCAPKKGKVKISLGDSLKCIISCKPVLLIASLLLCYNISINLIEGVWKKSIELYFVNNANHIHHFMSSVNFYMSILSIVFALGGVYLIRACKWSTSALITPITFAIAGGVFFVAMLFKDNPYMLSMGISALTIAVYFGAMHNVMARSTKHTLFDSTKEMAYIPLPDDMKTKGKAAAEMVGMRFGKGSGAFIQQVLLTLFSGLTLIELSPAIAIIFLAVMAWWMFSTLSLDKLLFRNKSGDESAPSGVSCVSKSA